MTSAVLNPPAARRYAGFQCRVGLNHVMSTMCPDTPRVCGLGAVITPAVTVDSKPSGLPMAIASCPTLSFANRQGRIGELVALGLDHGEVGPRVIADHAISPSRFRHWGAREPS